MGHDNDFQKKIPEGYASQQSFAGIGTRWTASTKTDNINSSKAECFGGGIGNIILHEYTLMRNKWDR